MVHPALASQSDHPRNLPVLKQRNERNLSRMFDQIIQFDAGAKTGRGSSIQNLECFCEAAMKKPGPRKKPF